MTRQRDDAPAPGIAMTRAVAGGAGTRMGSRLPKQYLTVSGAPLLVLTLRTLARCRALDGIVVAAPADRVEATRDLLRGFRVPRVLAVVAGGAARQDSVREGLQAAPADAAWIVVHDAVRPFITPVLVERVLAAARLPGAASCGWPVRETVKRVKDAVVEATLPREGLWLPQNLKITTPDDLKTARAWMSGARRS